MDDNMEKLSEEADVIFTATPQGLCASLVNEGILSRAKVIDLSADFRIKDVKKYEKWYGIEHKSPQFIEEAVYRSLRDQQGGYQKSAAGSQSGLLSHLFHALHLSSSERGHDRSVHHNHRREVRNVRGGKRSARRIIFSAR